jgi:hypothetical protein
MKPQSVLKWLSVIFLIVALLLSVSACSGAKSIPHQVAGRSDCISCHGVNTANPYPQGHAQKQYANEKCTQCHQPPASAAAGGR